jgi:hypothetical protein
MNVRSAGLHSCLEMYVRDDAEMSRKKSETFPPCIHFYLFVSRPCVQCEDYDFGYVSIGFESDMYLKYFQWNENLRQASSFVVIHISYLKKRSSAQANFLSCRIKKVRGIKSRTKTTLYRYK